MPSDQFLIQLAEHLKSKNREVPFVLPLQKNEQVPVPEPDLQSKKQIYSNQINSLLESGKTNEAADLFLKSLKENVTPARNTSRLLLNRLSSEGNVEKLLLFKPHYEKLHDSLNYFHKLTLAHVASGSPATVIEELEQLMKSDHSNIDISRRFPKATALNAILKDENLAKRCKYIFYLPNLLDYKFVYFLFFHS